VEVAEPDWEPAVQWSQFQAVRSGTTSPGLWYGASEVEPVWDAKRGRPYVSALRVRVARDGARAGGTGDGCEIPSRYLREEVEEAVAGLVGEGMLKAGERFRYRVTARPRRCRIRGSVAAVDDGIQVERLPQVLPIVEGSYVEASSGARTCDGEFADPVDVPVIMPVGVLEEAIGLAGAAGDVETGGVLVGALCRDSVRGDLYVEVRALLPARHAISRADRLTFTAETWEDARAAIALRGGGECWVGWMHSHPYFCRSCPAEARTRCVLTLPFLSEHDRALHRTVFVRPFDVALLVTDRGPGGRECALFGWRHGIVERRGYVMTGGAANLVLAGATLSAEGVEAPDADAVVHVRDPLGHGDLLDARDPPDTHDSIVRHGSSRACGDDNASTSP
jgi:hypothetical protein